MEETMANESPTAAATAATRSISVRGSLAEFCDYTTAHGLGRFVTQRRDIGRAVWICLLLGTYAGFTYHVYSLGLLFTSVPLTTSLSTSLPFEFPDVYFCPSDLATMSRLATQLDSGAVIRDVQCSAVCQQKGLRFKIDTTDDSQYSDIAQALLDTISAAQDNITVTLQYANTTNSTTCRSTLDGEEFTGNLTIVPVYQSLYLEKYNVSLITEAEPYVTYQQCIGWNEAARELKAAGVSLADRILAMGFADRERSCRQPSGIPLTLFYDFATYPLQRFVGCINMSYLLSVNTCFVDSTDVMNIDMCVQCCYNKQIMFAATSYNRCLCSNKLNSRTVISDWSLCNTNCPGSYNTKCGGDGQLMSVYRVIKMGNVSLTLPYRPTLNGLDNGPYCFYRGANASLWATYCNVPFCSISPNYDCLHSDVNSETSPKQHISYTGYRNQTQASDQCMDWWQLKTSLESGTLKYDWGNLTVARVLSVSIETSDNQLFDASISSSSMSYALCRPVSMVADVLVRQSSVHLYSRRRFYSDSPVCAYQESAGFVTMGNCNLPLCSSSIRSASSALTSRIGADLLLSRFGSSLGIGFSGCSIGSAACSRQDFTTIAHPQLGLCHKFNRDLAVSQLISNTVNPTDLVLSFKYFTDTTDVTGQTFLSLSGVLHTGRPHNDDDMNGAMQVIVVPSGQFPRSADAATVSPGQHLELKIQYDRTTRYSKPSMQGCLSSSESVTYTLPHWQSSWKLFNKSYVETVNLSAILSASSWLEKTSLLREALRKLTNGRSSINNTLKFESATIDDCIDEYVTQQFIQSCGCLPTFLPIRPQHFKDFTYCFNLTAGFDRIERCHSQQLSLLSLYGTQARQICLPLCESRDYFVKQATYPWPDISKLSADKFFQSEQSSWSYPDNFLGARGIAGLYYMGVQAQLVLDRSNAGNAYGVSDLLDYLENLRMVERRMARVTVRADSAYGQDVTEEPSYTIRNLMADLGGALGLWSGVSVLTVCEIVELLAFLAAALRQKLSNRALLMSSVGDLSAIRAIDGAASKNDVESSC